MSTNIVLKHSVRFWGLLLDMGNTIFCWRVIVKIFDSEFCEYCSSVNVLKIIPIKRACIFNNAFPQVITSRISAHHSRLQAAKKDQITFSWNGIPRLNLCIVNQGGAAFIIKCEGHEKSSLAPKDFTPCPNKKGCRYRWTLRTLY